LKKLYALLFAVSITAVAAQAATNKHTIKNGESLYVIAHKNHTTIAELQKVNGIKKGEKLKLGRVLTLPASKSPQSKKTKIVKNINKSSQNKKTQIAKNTNKTLLKSTNYKITKGDSLFTIAKKHHTTVEKIREANAMKKSETLKLGRVLKVPQNNIAKTTLAKAPQNKQKITLSQTKATTSNKKLVASISSLETISLSKDKVKKDEKLSLGKVLFGGKKDNLVKCDKSIGSEKCVRIASLAKKKLGRRYVFGATGNSNTFDCSGLTTYVYKQNGIKLPRRAIAQSKMGKRVTRDNLKKGDLVFFDTSKSHRGYVNHVGIYIGNDRFIHASSAQKRVIVTSLNTPFYNKCFKSARRLAS